jgi:hypothetical protein
MNPAALIPSPDALPAHWGWFYVLLLLTFLLHLLVMNAMLGGGIITLISSLRKGEQNLLLCREFSYKWPYTIAFAVNFGVAPLLFLQVLYGQFIYSSSVLIAAWWLSIIAMLILAYYAAYLYDFKFSALGVPRIFVAQFAVMLMLLIAFLFSNNMTLMLQPERWPDYFSNPAGTLLNLTDPSLIPRYLHFVVGAVAVAGLYLALIGHFRFNKGTVDPQALVSTGMHYFTVATLLQIPVGIWFLLALPRQVMMIFMGGSALATTLFVGGLLLTLVVLHFGYRRRVIAASLATLALMVVMVIMRDLVRTAYLSPWFQLADLSVDTQYSPLIFFLIVFVAGLALIAYMIRLALACRGEVAK